MNDVQVEQAQATTDIPRVKKDHIDQLASTIQYVEIQRPGDTTTTLCLAYLPGTNGKKFLLTTGVSACVVPELFNVQIGSDIARRNAEVQAIAALWQLEGYSLFKELNK
jgi:hypothetical protein